MTDSTEGGRPQLALARAAADPDLELDDKEIEQLIQELGITEVASKTGYMTFGQLGGNVIRWLCETLNPAENPFIYLLFGNTDAQQLAGLVRSKGDKRPQYLDDWLKLRGEGRFTLLQLGNGRGAGGNPQVAAAAFVPKASVIDAFVKEFSNLHIIIAGGGGTGTGAAEALPEILKPYKDRMGILFSYVMPFPVEGEERMAKAEAGRKKIADAGFSISTLYNQEIFNVIKTNPNTDLAKEMSEDDVHEGLHAVNEWGIKPQVEVTRHLAQEAATLNRDPADEMFILNQGGEVYVRSYIFPDDDGEGSKKRVTMRQAMAILLGDTIQNTDIVKRGNRAMLLLIGSFKKDEFREAMEILQERMKEGQPEKKLSLAPGLDKQPGKRKIHIMLSAPGVEAPKNVSAAAFSSDVTAAAEALEADMEKFRALTLEDFLAEQRTRGVRLVVDKDGRAHKMEEVSAGPTFVWALNFESNHRKLFTVEERNRHFDLFDAYMNAAELFGKGDKYRLFRPAELRPADAAANAGQPKAAGSIDYGIAVAQEEPPPRRSWWKFGK